MKKNVKWFDKDYKFANIGRSSSVIAMVLKSAKNGIPFYGNDHKKYIANLYDNFKQELANIKKGVFDYKIVLFFNNFEYIYNDGKMDLENIEIKTQIIINFFKMVIDKSKGEHNSLPADLLHEIQNLDNNYNTFIIRDEDEALNVRFNTGSINETRYPIGKRNFLTCVMKKLGIQY